MNGIFAFISPNVFEPLPSFNGFSHWRNTIDSYSGKCEFTILFPLKKLQWAHLWRAEVAEQSNSYLKCSSSVTFDAVWTLSVSSMPDCEYHWERFLLNIIKSSTSRILKRMQTAYDIRTLFVETMWSSYYCTVLPLCGRLIWTLLLSLSSKEFLWVQEKNSQMSLHVFVSTPANSKCSQLYELVTTIMILEYRMRMCLHQKPSCMVENSPKILISFVFNVPGFKSIFQNSIVIRLACKGETPSKWNDWKLAEKCCHGFVRMRAMNQWTNIKHWREWFFYSRSESFS